MSSAPVLRPHAVPAPADVRVLRRRVAAWALATGHAVDRDALAALLGARRAATGGADRPWTAADVGALLWVGIAEWCRDAGARLPDGEATRRSVLTYLAYLGAHRALPAGSDPAPVLRRAVREYGGGSGGPRSSRHPALRDRRPAPVVPIG